MRARSLVLALLPAGVSLVVAAAFLVAGNGLSIRVTVSVGAVVAMVGVVASAAMLATIFGRNRALRLRDDARQQGVREQRDSHRRFLARLDHELKNPLTAIRAALAADGAAAGAGPDLARSPHQVVIESQTRRLGDLVSDLRKLAELETVPIENEPVDLELLANDVVDAVREDLRAEALGDRSISVSFATIPWPVPSVRGDVDLLFLAIYNVVSNAVKYSGPDATIEVRGREDDGWAVIEVADTGIGIASDDLQHVFDELARGQNARGIPGSGLGLSLANAVAFRHRGTISVKSREGQGTSFRLRLPTNP